MSILFRNHSLGGLRTIGRRWGTVLWESLPKGSRGRRHFLSIGLRNSHYALKRNSLYGLGRTGARTDVHGYDTDFYGRRKSYDGCMKWLGIVKGAANSLMILIYRRWFVPVSHYIPCNAYHAHLSKTSRRMRQRNIKKHRFLFYSASNSCISWGFLCTGSNSLRIH